MVFACVVVKGDADVVFGFEAILDDVELEATDGAQDGVAFHAFEIVEDLDGAFLGEFVETFFELFSLEGARRTTRTKCSGLNLGMPS